MIQENQNPQTNDQKDTNEVHNRDNKGDSSAGSQAATTGYGTGQAGGQGTAAAPQGKDTPSNAGDAGFNADEARSLSDDRTDQMSHADGSSEVDDPDT